MTENPKSCKIRVFQSENNYSPHHEHVHPSNLPDPHHVLGPMRAQQHGHMTPQDNLELEIILTMKREQMRALDQYHVTSRDNLDLKIIRTLPENIILRSREHHVT